MELSEILIRQINAPHRKIARDVPQDICKLERDAELFRQFGRARLGKTKNVQAAKSMGSPGTELEFAL